MPCKRDYFLLLLCCFLPIGVMLYGQTVNWISFEDLEKSMREKSKKVLIHFKADWCAYCKKMDRVVYRNQQVSELLSESYYAVQFDVESLDTITYLGVAFTNKLFGKVRRPVHDIALYFAERSQDNFTLPAIILLDEHLNIKQQFFRYMDPEEMAKILND